MSLKSGVKKVVKKFIPDFSNFRTAFTPGLSKTSERCRNEMTAQYDGVSYTCTAYTRQYIISFLYFLQFIIVCIVIGMVFLKLPDVLKDDEKKNFDITWATVFGVSLIFFALYAILLFLGIISTSPFGSDSYFGRLFQNNKKKTQKELDFNIGQFQRCKNRKGGDDCEALGGFYYKARKDGNDVNFYRIKCKFDEKAADGKGKCKKVDKEKSLSKR